MTDPDAFDPTRALDGWRAPTPAPLDLELRSLRQPVAAEPGQAKKAWLKQRGYATVDVEDIDVAARPRHRQADTAALDLRAAPPATPDARQVLDTLDLPRPAREAPCPPDPRLLAPWQPHAWVAQVRRVADASVEVHQAADGMQVTHQPPQWLCALWPPAELEPPRLARWPAVALLASADNVDAALAHLLPELPNHASLWRADANDADWVLLAELVLQQDASLTPTQKQALRELADAERRAALRHMTHDYQHEGRLTRRRP